MTPCARLHPIPGAHAPGCTCTRDCPDHDDHCRGCAPAEATRGLLCARCSQQLRDNLGASEGLDPDNPVHGLPWAWEHLAVAYPSLTQAPGGGGSSIDDPEAERLTAVISARTLIHDILSAWVDDVAEHAGLAGPLIPDWRPGTTLETRRGVRIRRRAEWLLIHVEVLESHEAVTDAWQELADLMSRAHALAPWRPAPTQIQGIPCRCGAMALHDQGDQIVCWVCRANYDREHYRALTVVFARRFADDPSGAGVIARPRLAKEAAVPEGEPAPSHYGGRA